MTARKAGELAAGGVFATLKRLRDQWVLLVFMASALFWARDIYEEFADLPTRMAALGVEVGELRSGVERLSAGQAAATASRAAGQGVPGMGHAVQDGRPEDIVIVSLATDLSERNDCNTELAAFMVDSAGKRFSAEAELIQGEQDEESEGLAFGVKIHPRMDVGRAELLVQLIRKCGSRNMETSLRLPFRVLPR